jgi:peptide deformylase
MSIDYAYLGHPILRKKARPIEHIDDSIRLLIKQMKELTDRRANAIGLCAPQVGASIRLLMVLFDGFDPRTGRMRIGPPKILINSMVHDASKERWIEEEGCVSLPKIYEKVERPVAITICYQDEHGAHHTERLEGWPARTVMHENDHLNGVLFIDRVEAKRKKQISKYLEEIKKHYKNHNEHLKLWGGE